MKHLREILNFIHLKYLTGNIRIVRFIKYFQIFKQLTLLSFLIAGKNLVDVIVLTIDSTIPLVKEM